MVNTSREAGKKKRQPVTWRTIYDKYVRRGYDPCAAHLYADEWEKNNARKVKENG